MTYRIIQHITEKSVNTNNPLYLNYFSDDSYPIGDELIISLDSSPPCFPAHIKKTPFGFVNNDYYDSIIKACTAFNMLSPTKDEHDRFVTSVTKAIGQTITVPHHNVSQVYYWGYDNPIKKIKEDNVMIFHIIKKIAERKKEQSDNNGKI